MTTNAMALIADIKRQIDAKTAEIEREEDRLREQKRLVEEQHANVKRLDRDRESAAYEVKSCEDKVRIYTPTDTAAHLADAKREMDSAFQATQNLKGCPQSYIEDKQFRYKLAKQGYDHWVKALHEAERELENYKSKVVEAKRKHRDVNLAFEKACNQHAKSNLACRRIEENIEKLYQERDLLEIELEKQIKLAREADLKRNLQILREETDVAQRAVIDLCKQHDGASGNWDAAYQKIENEFNGRVKVEGSEFDLYLFSLTNEQHLSASLPVAPGGPEVSAADLQQFRLHMSQSLHGCLDAMHLECAKNSLAASKMCVAFSRKIEQFNGILAKAEALDCAEIKESTDLKQTIEKIRAELNRRSSDIVSIVKKLNQLKDELELVKQRLVKEEAQYSVQQAQATAGTIAVTNAGGPSNLGPSPSSNGPNPNAGAGENGGDGGRPPLNLLQVVDNTADRKGGEEEARRAREAAVQQQDLIRRVQANIRAKYEEDKKKKEDEARVVRIQHARAAAARQRELDRLEEQRRQQEELDRKRREEEARAQQQPQQSSQQHFAYR